MNRLFMIVALGLSNPLAWADSPPVLLGKGGTAFLATRRTAEPGLRHTGQFYKDPSGTQLKWKWDAPVGPWFRGIYSRPNPPLEVKQASRPVTRQTADSKLDEFNPGQTEVEEPTNNPPQVAPEPMSAMALAVFAAALMRRRKLRT